MTNLPPRFEVGIRIIDDPLLFLLRGQEVSQGDAGHGQALCNRGERSSNLQCCRSERIRKFFNGSELEFGLGSNQVMEKRL
jgi:hypothetical protein